MRPFLYAATLGLLASSAPASIVMDPVDEFGGQIVFQMDGVTIYATGEIDPAVDLNRGGDILGIDGLVVDAKSFNVRFFSANLADPTMFPNYFAAQNDQTGAQAAGAAMVDLFTTASQTSGLALGVSFYGIGDFTNTLGILRLPYDINGNMITSHVYQLGSSFPSFLGSGTPVPIGNSSTVVYASFDEVAAIPEPSTYLIWIGLGLLGFMVCRKKPTP